LRDALRLFRAIVKRTGSIRTTTDLSDSLERVVKSIGATRGLRLRCYQNA
jgi:hypothetical protein